MKTKMKKFQNEDTAERVRQALQKLKPGVHVVLARVPSSDPDNPPYEIRLGANNTVWCVCSGFKFRNHCRHMEQFRNEPARLLKGKKR